LRHPKFFQTYADAIAVSHKEDHALSDNRKRDDGEKQQRPHKGAAFVKEIKNVKRHGQVLTEKRRSPI